MFDSFMLEILYFSIIPVVVMGIITLIVLFLSRGKEDKYKYAYIIKILLIIMISIALPLFIGYTIWFIERCIGKGILILDIGLIIVFSILIISLITLLIMICRRLYQSIDNKI